MTTTTEPIRWTEEQLMSLPDIGHKVELIGGRIVMTPAGSEHGGIGAYLAGKLAIHVRERKLGWVFDSSTGFWLESGNLRSPDVSFIAKSRLKGMKRLPRGFFKGAPDLAGEILSPSDTMDSIHSRMIEYFDNGTRLAWIIQPTTHTVTIYAEDCRPVKTLTMGEILGGGDLVPGFELPLAELFAEPDFD